jgi:hypothetical protein
MVHSTAPYTGFCRRTLRASSESRKGCGSAVDARRTNFLKAEKFFKETL